ncbi:hypothetical protein SeLEV6574_g05696 [Synchytrium endobioticum]|uniref:RRM domain-containing protein n=1 Tax=Synchytrium endobioticum TaxID=286115 RepID=A0A507CST5_9FUNG|nr:hypothetical protein SeLEV6574_g05696 [Synchytrium endobioticum]
MSNYSYYEDSYQQYQYDPNASSSAAAVSYPVPLPVHSSAAPKIYPATQLGPSYPDTGITSIGASTDDDPSVLLNGAAYPAGYRPSAASQAALDVLAMSNGLGASATGPSGGTSSGPAPSTSHASAAGDAGRKKKKILRAAGGEIWEDETLLEWDTNDFRMFVGDLGNECNDDMLAKAFNKYQSFQKARVIRDKRTGKTKGYGFVSFKNPDDFTLALREMNGKYIGNRPCKIRKSNWTERSINPREVRGLKRTKEGGIVKPAHMRPVFSSN